MKKTIRSFGKSKNALILVINKRWKGFLTKKLH